MPARAFDRIGIDLYGPLPNSPSGNCCVVVTIDHLARYHETSALSSATAKEVACFILENIVVLHGALHELLSERGRVLLTDVTEAMLKEYLTVLQRRIILK